MPATWPEKYRQKTQISHSFTHFTWHLEAVIFVVDQDQQEHLAIELQGCWMSPQTATEAGIPTAMKKLITSVNL